MCALETHISSSPEHEGDEGDEDDNADKVPFNGKDGNNGGDGDDGGEEPPPPVQEPLLPLPCSPNDSPVTIIIWCSASSA